MPALPGSVDHDQGFHAGALGGGPLGDLGSVPVGRADQGLDAGSVEAVLKVMLLQLVGCGDRDGAQFVQGHHGEPELIVPLEHQHDPVAPLDSQGGEIVGALVGGVLDILEGEAALLMMLVHIEHGQLIRILAGDLVHDIKTEVEGFMIREADGSEPSLLILLRVNKLLGNQVTLIPGRLGYGREISAALLSFNRKDHRQEDAVLPVHGDHAVRQGGVVIDAVAFLQDLGMVADLDLQAAGKHQVEFLSLVGGRMDRLILLLFGIFIANPVRLRHLIPEFRRQVRNGDAFFLRGGFALAAAGHRVGGQESIVAFQQFRQLHVESLGGLVDESKGHVGLAGFVIEVFRNGYLRLFRHFLRGPAHDLPHFTDTGSNRTQLAQISPGCHLETLLSLQCKVCKSWSFIQQNA